jgi:integrase
MIETKDQAKQERWEKTRVQHLIRFKKTGVYYARSSVGRKDIWRSLGTTHFFVAQAKLSEFLAEVRQQKKTALSAVVNGHDLTFGAVLAAHLERLASNVQAKRSKSATEHYWRQIFAMLLKSWPDLAERDVRKISVADCETWAREFANVVSPQRYNNALAGLRHVFDLAVERSLILSNPAAKLRRVPIRQKHLVLPSTETFLRLLEVVRTSGAGCARGCGDFLEGLAVTGARLRDAGALEWRDLDFGAGEIVLRGDAETGTKSWSVGRIPMIPRARALFERMRSERSNEPQTAKVFRVRESQKAIDSACRKLGIERFTHHDLRHFFATTCIESGVDVPTVSRWLLHKDGGALAMKTYGHLRREHSAAAALKVAF